MPHPKQNGSPYLVHDCFIHAYNGSSFSSQLVQLENAFAAFDANNCDSDDDMVTEKTQY